MSEEINAKKFGALLQSANKMQEKVQASLAKTQAELSRLEVAGEAGGGMVRVQMSGERKVRAVFVSPEAAADREMLQDLLASAVNDALAKVEDAISQKMRSSMADMLAQGD